MQKMNQKTNLFLSILGKAAKGAAACLVALLLMGILDNVSKNQKANSKENLLRAGKDYSLSIEDKVKK